MQVRPVTTAGPYPPAHGMHMAQSFRQLYYHAIWSTKDRMPLLAKRVRPVLYEVIEDKCRRLGCQLHAVNAVDDHVHLAIEIPPALSVSSVLGQIKGASAHQVNQLCPDSIHWQDGYGVVTFRRAELEKVKRYIATQEERHRSNALSPLLETWQDPETDE